MLFIAVIVIAPIVALIVLLQRRFAPQLSARHAQARPAAPLRQIGPDDDPEFIARLAETVRIRRGDPPDLG